MTKTYAQLMKQIETLNHEAEKLKRKEIDGVISRIKEAIEAYGLTAADLGLAGARAPRSRAGSAAAAPAKAGRRRTRAGSKYVPQVKYRDGEGNTWVGRGPRPQWLRDALANGKTLADFAV
jgi:DNA-binding protein H-NS